MRKIWYRFLNALFTRIRKRVLGCRYDPNEDYICMTCSKPVLSPILHCSPKCDPEGISYWTQEQIDESAREGKELSEYFKKD